MFAGSSPQAMKIMVRKQSGMLKIPEEHGSETAGNEDPCWIYGMPGGRTEADQ